MNNIIYFLDTETTGLNASSGHTIIEFCCIKHVDRVEVDQLYLRIIPTVEDLKRADPNALSKNKFNLEEWHRTGITKHAAAKKIAEFVTGSKSSAIVAHNVGFDMVFLKSLMKATNTDHRLPYRCIDSLAVSYARFEPFGLRSFSLDSIRSWLGWSLHNSHTAEQDVKDLIRLWDILSPRPITEEDVVLKEIIVNKRINHVIKSN